jgi:hypothetical protein
MSQQLVPSHHVAEADWYGAALDGFGGRVDQVIPRGYPAYARILHPASDERDEPARWSEVAAWAGTVLHPLAQFHALAGRWEYDARAGVGWPGENPYEGSLDAPQLRQLCRVLARHTSAADRCWLTVWEGFGNLPDVWERTSPRVQQRHRAYYIFERPLSEVFELSAQVDRVGKDQEPLPRSMARLVASADSAAEQEPGVQWTGKSAPPVRVQSPNQWWPEDRAWCVATEIDFDSTLVAGSEELVEEITNHPELEAFTVGPTDDLSHAGDEINPHPPRR